MNIMNCSIEVWSISLRLRCKRSVYPSRTQEFHLLTKLCRCLLSKKQAAYWIWGWINLRLQRVAKKERKRTRHYLQVSRRPIHFFSPRWRHILIQQLSSKKKHLIFSRLRLLLCQLLKRRFTIIATIRHHSLPLQITSFNTTPLISTSFKDLRRILRSLWLLNKTQLQLQQLLSLLRGLHSWFHRQCILLTINCRPRMLLIHSSRMVLNHQHTNNQRSRKAILWIWSHSLKQINQTSRLRQVIYKTVKLRLSWHHLTRRNES